MTMVGLFLKTGSNMGYYTAYGLEIIPDKGYASEIEEFEKELIDYSENDREIEELVKTGGCYGKLYDITDWISELAPKFPHILICLGGDGEESDDLWESRWKGSETETQISVIPPFNNPNLLTEYEKKNNK